MTQTTTRPARSGPLAARPAPAPPAPAGALPDLGAHDPWTFTPRARAQMDALGLSLADVLDVLARPASLGASRRAGAMVATRAGVHVVHHQGHLQVISVLGERRG